MAAKSVNIIFEIEDLRSARAYFIARQKNLSNFNEGKVILSNVRGSSRFYGMRVIDRIFNILKKEFPDQICGFMVNASNDIPAANTARELGYKHALL